jgi:ATP-dependent Clp protease, protease subunit
MPVYVSFSAEINANTTEVLIATLANQANSGVDHVYLMLSTPGGNVMNGLNLYNVLRAFPFKLTTHNVGNVDSIGNAVFLAGSERIASPHSTFMFHGVGFDWAASVRLEQKNAQELLDSLLADQTRIANVIVDRTRLTYPEAADLFKEARTKDAAFALDKGIVGAIGDVNIPAGAAVLSLVFQR